METHSGQPPMQGEAGVLWCVVVLAGSEGLDLRISVASSGGALSWRKHFLSTCCGPGQTRICLRGTAVSRMDHGSGLPKRVRIKA